MRASKGEGRFARSEPGGLGFFPETKAQRKANGNKRTKRSLYTVRIDIPSFEPLETQESSITPQLGSRAFYQLRRYYECPSEASPGGSGGIPPGKLDCLLSSVREHCQLRKYYERPSEAHRGVGAVWGEPPSPTQETPIYTLSSVRELYQLRRYYERPSEASQGALGDTPQESSIASSARFASIISYGNITNARAKRARGGFPQENPIYVA
jgi:hypothetical protein